MAADLLDHLAPYAVEAEGLLREKQRDRDPYIAQRAASALRRMHHEGVAPPPALGEAEYEGRVLAFRNIALPAPNPADAQAERPVHPKVRERSDAAMIERLSDKLLHGSIDAQFDALNTLGIEPVEHLVLPHVLTRVRH